MHIIIAPTWLRGRAKKNNYKNIKLEKLWQIACVMDVTQKDRYFGETIHFLNTLWKFDMHVM